MLGEIKRSNKARKTQQQWKTSVTPHLSCAIITFSCDAETEFLASIDENYTKEAVWGIMRGEASLGTGLQQHAGPGSKHT